MTELNPGHSKHHLAKIHHQIQNEGCRCQLCQRLVLQKMKVIKNQVPPELKNQLTISNQKESYFIKFLSNFYFYDKLARRIRLAIPQICVFEKSAPLYLLTKKRDQNQLKVIKNKEKLNFYEIKNFFYEGYTYHNRTNDLLQTQNYPKYKVKHSTTFQVKNKQMLKNECIVIARFTNNPGQILSPLMMDNLFKYSQKQFRANLLYIQTLVSSKDYQQIRIKMHIRQFLKEEVFLRAKTEIQIINEEIKSTEYGYITEKEEIEYQEQLKKSNWKKYLEYVSLKIVLMDSYKTQELIQQAVFKFVKGYPDVYYFVDLQVAKFSNKQQIWGPTNKYPLAKILEERETLRSNINNRQEQTQSQIQIMSRNVIESRENDTRSLIADKLHSKKTTQSVNESVITRNSLTKKSTILGISKKYLN